MALDLSRREFAAWPLSKVIMRISQESVSLLRSTSSSLQSAKITHLRCGMLLVKVERMQKKIGS